MSEFAINRELAGEWLQNLSNDGLTYGALNSGTARCQSRGAETGNDSGRLYGFMSFGYIGGRVMQDDVKGITSVS